MNRSEILFLYDIQNNNPNGDPLDSNKPRMDEETGFNLVTDVRLKRTIRDYLYKFKGYNENNGKDIFVRTITNKAKEIQDGKNRAKDFENDADKILQNCIDIRLFGGVIPLPNDSITFTGPVQFKMGRSLHQVEIQYIKGTGAFASASGKKQQTFREEYILPYSLIGFYGIINENAAKTTNLTDDDIELLIESIWEGTKNLISRSKVGQNPQLLIKIDYKKDESHIGGLEQLIKIESDKDDLELRSTNDFSLNIQKLIDIFEYNKNKIDTIFYKKNTSLKIEPQIPSTWTELK